MRWAKAHAACSRDVSERHALLQEGKEFSIRERCTESIVICVLTSHSGGIGSEVLGVCLISNEKEEL